jgi:hypothetical protein
MTTQIFKKQLPNNILFELLDKICLKNEKHYTFNKDSFKRGVYNGVIQDFFTLCYPYYFLSKQKYLDRKLTFNSFTTVLRQICNCNKITYTSQIKYSKSTYNIEYYIYY